MLILELRCPRRGRLCLRPAPALRFQTAKGRFRMTGCASKLVGKESTLRLQAFSLAATNGVALGGSGFRIRDAESALTSRKSRISIVRTGSPSPKPKEKGEEWETNPIEVTCFLSTTYGIPGRNKPKGDMSNVFSRLERNYAAFWRNLNDVEPAIH